VRARVVVVMLVGLALGLAALAVPGFTSHVSVTCDELASAANGSDTSGDGSEGNPYRTVGALLVDLDPGQTGCLRGSPDDTQPSSEALYEETVEISDAGATLRSYPHEVAHVKGRVTVLASNVTLSQLVLDGRNQFGHPSPRIASGADGAKLIDNDITSRSTSPCVRLDGDAPTDIDNLSDPSWIRTVEVRHNRFHDCVTALEIEHAQQPAVTDNLFIDNIGVGIRLSTNTDYANVSHNVIDGSARNVGYVAGADLNWVGQNAISNPASFNLTAGSPLGSFNLYSQNCVWKSGGNGFNNAYTTNGWTPGKVTVMANVVANPIYNADWSVPSSSGCFSTTGSLSAAADDGDRPSEEEAVNLRPNVMFIVTDDHRADTMDMMPNTVGWFKGDGDPGAGTDNGTEFTQGFVTTPLCCPSRASILSGRFVHNHGVDENSKAGAVPSKSLLPWYLKRAGYYNAIYGKYLNGWEPNNPPLLTHVDQDTSQYPAGTPPYFDDFGLYELQYANAFVREKSSSAPGYADVSTGLHGAEYLAGKVESFLTGRDSTPAADAQPWFLYLGPSEPHEKAFPLEGTATASSERWGPNAWNRMTAGNPFATDPVREVQPPVEADRTDKPRWVQEYRFNDSVNGYDNRAIFERIENEIRYPGLQKQMFRTLKLLDTKLQRVYDKLEATGEADDTLAFFIGDNGYHWREHGGAAGDCVDTTADQPGEEVILTPFCGLSGKAKPYLEAVRVPFLMRWLDSPLVSRDHTENARLVANIDLAPTVMDAIDQAPQAPLGEPQMDGRSILSPWQREYLFAEGGVVPNRNPPPWKALISPSLHFISYDDDPATTSVNDPFLERYDLTTDPIEHENLYGPGGAYDPALGEPEPTALLSLIDQYDDCSASNCP